MSQLTLITAPAARALDWMEDIRPGLRLDNDLEKKWIERNLLPAAEKWCEAEANGRALITQTWALRLASFPASSTEIMIPRPPLQSITSIEYVDSNGVLQTWSDTLWETEDPALAGEKAGHGHVWPAYGQSYPTPRVQPIAVIITFKCGYGDNASDIPAGLRTAMIAYIAHGFEHREAVIEGSLQEVPMGARHQARMYAAWGT